MQIAIDKQALLAEIEAKLAVGGYEAADDYYADKMRAVRIRAEIQGKAAYQIDPMAYWHG